MTGLSDFPAYLHGAALAGILAATGLGVGTLAGLFGVGGAALITPLLNVLLGIPYTLAAGSSLSFNIGTSSAGLARHLRLKHVATRTMCILAVAGAAGTVLGAELHLHLKSALAGLGAEAFTLTMHGLFLVVLGASAWLVARGSPRAPEELTPLQRLPIGPFITIRRANLKGVSLLGLGLVGLGIGVLSGLLGIAGGILLTPILLRVVGLSMQQAVGTSLGVILINSTVGAVLYGRAGEVNLWVVMSLLAGSTLGVQVGAWLCVKWHAQRIGRCFAGLILVVMLIIGWDFLHKARH